MTAHSLAKHSKSFTCRPIPVWKSALCLLQLLTVCAILMGTVKSAAYYTTALTESPAGRYDGLPASYGERNKWTNDFSDFYMTDFRFTRRMWAELIQVNMIFRDEFRTKPLVDSGWIGSNWNTQNLPYVNVTTQSATGFPNRIVRIQFCGYIFDTTRTAALTFYFADGTSKRVPPDYTLCGGEYYIPSSGELPGRVRGLSWHSWMSTINSEPRITHSSWSVWYDSTTDCSKIKVDVTPAGFLTILAEPIPSASSVSMTLGYTLGPGGTGCGASTDYQLMYTAPLTLPTWLTFTSPTFTGSTNNPAHIGAHTIKFLTELYPYDLSDGETHLSIVITCVQDTPICTSTALTFEVGITSIILPAILTTFSQGTNFCQAIAKISSSPPAPWLSLTLNTAAGGAITLGTGLLRQHFGVYTITLTNSIIGQPDQTDTLQLTIVDPCKLAVFETDPNPFQNVVITWPASNLKFTPFHVYTDKERFNSSIHCETKVTFVNTPAWAPISVIDPLQHQIDPNLIVFTDIGVHTIQANVENETWPTLQNSQTFTFSVTVLCTVTSFTLTPSDMAFDYILKSPSVIKGPFTANQIADCKYPVTYSVARYENNVFKDNPTNFDTNNMEYTLYFSDPAQIMTLQTFHLTASITIHDGSVMTTTSILNINIQPCCEFTRLVDKDINNMSILVTQTETQNIFFDDTTSDFFSDPNFCGGSTKRTFEWSPELDEFLIIDANQQNLTLMTMDPKYHRETPYNYTLQVKLSDWPLQPILTKTLKVTITCKVFSITPVMLPPEKSSYRIGADSQILMPVAFTEFPACGLTYKVEPTNQFVRFNNTDGLIHVKSRNVTDAGVYNLELMVQPVTIGNTLIIPFQVTMIDICEKTKFYKQTLKSIVGFLQDPGFDPNQLIKFDPIQYEALTVYDFDCGLMQVALVQANGDAVPSWIKLNQEVSEISVDFKSASSPGRVDLQLRARLEAYPDIKISFDFYLSLSSSVLKCLPSSSKTYNYGSPPIMFGVSYQNQTFSDGLKLTPKIEPIAIKQGVIEPLPNFVKFNANNKLFTVSQISEKDFGDIKVGLMITYTEFPSFEATCTVDLELKYLPKFTGDKPSAQKIVCGSPWSLLIPPFVDIFGQNAKAEVDLGQTMQFLTWNTGSRIVTLMDNTSSLPAGDYSIKVMLADTYGGNESFQIKIEVFCFNKNLVEIKSSVSFKPDPNLKQRNPPKPSIEWITQIGKVRVSFSSPLVIPSFGLYPEFLDENLMQQNCTQASAKPNQCYPLRQLQQTIEEKTKEALEIVNRGLVLVEDELVPIIQLKMAPGLESELRDLDFTWRCVDFQPSYMDFNILYQRYQNVSIHDQKDSLEVKFNGYQYFRSAENNEYIEQSVSIVRKSVPLQMDPEGSAGLTAAIATVQSASKGVVLLNFVLGGAIQQLFSAIRKMTIMVHLLIINVKIPANAQMYFAGLLTFVTFDIIELGPYIRKGLNLQDADMLVNDNFESLGYQSIYFPINFGTLILLLVYLFVMLLFYACTYGVSNPKFKRCRAAVTRGLIWNSVLSFVIESYMLLSISSVANLTALQFVDLGTAVSSNMSIAVLLLLIGFPLFTLSFLIRKKKKLNSQKYQQKYGVLYQALNVSRSTNWTMCEPVLSFYRMLVLTLVLIFLQDYRYFQLFFVNISMTSIIVFVGVVEPFADKTTSFFQQFNEVFVAITNYHLMCFADFVKDERTRNIVGMSMIVCVSLNLTINIGFIMFGAIKDACRKLQIKYFKWKLKRIRQTKEAKQLAADISKGVLVIDNEEQKAEEVFIETVLRRPKLVLMENSEITAVIREKAACDQFFVNDINFYEKRPKMRAIDVAGSLDSARFEVYHQNQLIVDNQIQLDRLLDSEDDQQADFELASSPWQQSDIQDEEELENPARIVRRRRIMKEQKPGSSELLYDRIWYEPRDSQP